MKIMGTFINLEIVSCPFPIARDSETISLGDNEHETLQKII